MMVNELEGILVCEVGCIRRVFYGRQVRAHGISGHRPSNGYHQVLDASLYFLIYRLNF